MVLDPLKFGGSTPAASRKEVRAAAVNNDTPSFISLGHAEGADQVSFLGGVIAPPAQAKKAGAANTLSGNITGHFRTALTGDPDQDFPGVEPLHKDPELTAALLERGFALT